MTDVATSTARKSLPWTRRALFFALTLGVLQGVLAWQLRTPAVATRHSDDAEYVMLGRELLEGRYREPFYENTPVHARYPPGYPLVLAAVQWLVGPRESAFIILNILISITTTLLLLNWARRELPTWTWVVFGVAVATNPDSLQLAGTALSEPFFGMMIVLGLVLDERHRSRWSGWLATLTLAATSVVRTAGVAISAGVIAARLLERRLSAAAALLAVTAATGGAWLVFTMTRTDTTVTYSDDLTVARMTDPISVLTQIIRGLPGKIRAVAVDQVPTALGFPTVAGPWIDNLFGALLLLLLLPVGLYAIWKRWPAAAWAIIGYGALNFIWPWTLVRYVVPLGPLLLLSLFAGAVTVATWVRHQRARPVLVTVLGLYLVTGAGLRLSAEARRWADCDRSNPLVNPSCFPSLEDWSVVEAAKFMSTLLPRGAVVFADKAVAFHYYSGLRTLRADEWLMEDSASLAPALRRKGVEWAVASKAGPHRPRHGALIAAACRDFDLVHAIDSTTVILRLRALQATSDWGEACDATRALRRRPGDPVNRAGQPPGAP